MDNIRLTNITLLDGNVCSMRYSENKSVYTGEIHARITIRFTISFTEDSYIITSEPEVVKELADEIARIISGLESATQ